VIKRRNESERKEGNKNVYRKKKVPDVGSWITPSAHDYDTFEALAMMKAEKADIHVASKKKDRKSPQASKPLPTLEKISQSHTSLLQKIKYCDNRLDIAKLI